jgi:hypothetical protein
MAVHVTASYARRKQRIARRTSAAHIESAAAVAAWEVTFRDGLTISWRSSWQPDHRGARGLGTS